YRFVETGRVALRGLPRNPSAVAAIPGRGEALTLVLAVSDGTRYSPEGPGGRDPEYNPYDGRGIWRGGHPYAALYAVDFPKGLDEDGETARRLSPSDRDVRANMGRLTPIDLG